MISAEGPRRSLRVRLFAAPPDRLHVEIGGPVGGPRFIVDGGAGRLSVVSVARSLAWAGADSPADVRRVLGIEASLREVVAALLGEGTLPGATASTRDPADAQGLPRRFEVDLEEARLRLDLVRWEPLAPEAVPKVGTGATPSGLEVRPLESLERSDVAWQGTDSR